ncbi:MAG: hypothetical protein A2X23_11705 [Chloroflexi bacterium GWC2_73_18]|nr:MAG: hypothetical protein A2X23_11705 [Chloroflexi bacterium GWC2_73_18]
MTAWTRPRPARGLGATVDFAYDTRGNLTSNAESGATVTVYGYDWADRLTSIDPPGASNTGAFTFDALGRLEATLGRLSVNGGVGADGRC